MLNREIEPVMTTLSEGREISEKEAHESVMLGDSMSLSSDVCLGEQEK